MPTTLPRREERCGGDGRGSKAPGRHAVPSQSTRYEAGQTIAYDKEGVRSTQILGGNDYDKAPRLTEYVVSLTAALSSVAGQVRPLSPQSPDEQARGLRCDRSVVLPKHIDGVDAMGAHGRAAEAERLVTRDGC